TGGRTGEQGNAILFAGNVLNRQRHRGVGEVSNGRDPVAIEPLAGACRTNVGLVLVVGRHQRNVHALALVGQTVINGQLGRSNGTGSAHGGVSARHVGQHTDFHSGSGGLSGTESGHQAGRHHGGSESHDLSPLFVL